LTFHISSFPEMSQICFPTLVPPATKADFFSPNPFDAGLGISKVRKAFLTER